MNKPDTGRRRNGLLLVGLLGIVAVMVGLSFAAVPLYSLFCRTTGFGGTPQVGEAAPGRVLDRTMRIRFTAAADHALGWRFEPETREMTLRVGEPALVYFEAENLGAHAVTGVATFNVSPDKAGQYFVKVQCFCFSEQTLQPGQRVDLPVYFYVDPALADDVNLDDVRVITLSYTFFPALGTPAAAAPPAAAQTAQRPETVPQ